MLEMPDGHNKSRAPLAVIATDHVNRETCLTMLTALHYGWPVGYHDPTVDIMLEQGESAKAKKVELKRVRPIQKLVVGSCLRVPEPDTTH